IFARHLDRNRDWIPTLIKAHEAYCGTDYETFKHAYREPFPRLWLGQVHLLTFWKQESRLRLIERAKNNLGWGITRPYERLLSFFTSYIVIQSGSAQLTLLTDHYSLWRTTRAIAMGLYLFILEAFIVTVGTPKFFIPWLAVLGLGITAYITSGTYSRLCFTL